MSIPLFGITTPDNKHHIAKDEEYSGHAALATALGFMPEADPGQTDEDTLLQQEGRWKDLFINDGYLRHLLNSKPQLIVQGDPERLTPELIEELLVQYKVPPAKTELLIDDLEDMPLHKGTLADYMLKYDQRRKQSQLARLVASLGEYN